MPVEKIEGVQDKSHILLEAYDVPEDNKTFETGEDTERKIYRIEEAGTIGRKLNNNIFFAEDLHMSNMHCKISLVNDKYFLEDLSSTNG